MNSVNQRRGFFAGASAVLAFFLACGNDSPMTPSHAQSDSVSVEGEVQLAEPVTVDGTVGVTGDVGVTGTVTVDSGTVSVDNLNAPSPRDMPSKQVIEARASTAGTTGLDFLADGPLFLTDVNVFRGSNTSGVTGFLVIDNTQGVCTGLGSNDLPTGDGYDFVSVLRDTDTSVVGLSGAHVFVPEGSTLCFELPGGSAISATGYRP